MAFEIARRHRFLGDLARLPDDITVHVLPTGQTDPPRYNDLKQLRYRDASQIARTSRAPARRPPSTCEERGGLTMPAPPKIVRRLVIGPLVVGIELLVIAALAARAARRRAAVAAVRRLAARADAVIVISLLAHHLAAIAACLRLWLARPGRRFGPGAVRDAYYAVLRGLIEASYRTIVRATRVQVRLCDSDAAEEILRAPGPVVVLSRHAGEGDTLLAAHDLLCRYERRPRVVMHRLLRLDPVIDVLGSRLPNRFIDPRGGDIEHEIAELARDMDDRDALLIFPEGGNSTAGRRRRGVQRLEQAGHAGGRLGAQHALPHRPAARRSAGRDRRRARPGRDLRRPRRLSVLLRRGVAPAPARQTVEVRMWAVPAQDVPADREAAIGWLFGWWKTLDDWVAERYDAQARLNEPAYAPSAGGGKLLGFSTVSGCGGS